MWNTQDPLKRVRVATPCAANWERMAGDERARHCTLCELNVYNFAEMTRDEIRTLLMKTEGRICARLYRREDGTLLTRDCPSRIQRLRQRTSRVASAILAGVMSLSSLAFGCATSNRKDSRVKVAIERKAATPELLASLGGVVLDETKTPLPGVTVVVRSEELQHEVTTVTDRNGAFLVKGLKDGAYRVEVRMDGFKTAVVEHLALKMEDVAHANVAMRFDNIAFMGVIVTAAPGMTTDGLKTTITSEFLDSIPIGN
jgi:hypothetical protein